MLFLVKLNPEYSSKLLVEAKGTCALFLFLLAKKKKAFIVSFRWDTKILTADRTAGSAAVCKVWAKIRENVTFSPILAGCFVCTGTVKTVGSFIIFHFERG